MASRTAKTAYNDNRHAINAQITALCTALTKMDAEAGDDPNWADVGTAAHIKSQLADILAFVSGEDD